MQYIKTYIEILKTLIRQQSFLDHLPLEEIVVMRSISSVIKKMIDKRISIDRRCNSVRISSHDRTIFKMTLNTRLLSINPFNSDESILNHDMSCDMIEDVTIEVRSHNNERSILCSTSNMSYNLMKINDYCYRGIIEYKAQHIIEEHYYFMIDGEMIDVQSDEYYITFCGRHGISMLDKNTELSSNISSSVLRVIEILKDEKPLYNDMLSNDIMSY